MQNATYPVTVTLNKSVDASQRWAAMRDSDLADSFLHILSLPTLGCLSDADLVSVLADLVTLHRDFHPDGTVTQEGRR